MSASPTPLGREEARVSCDRQVARAAEPLLLVTGLLLFAFTLATPFVTPFPASVPIAVAEALLGVAFVGGHVALKRGRAVRYVNPIFTALSLGALGAAIVSYAAIGSAHVTSAVVLLILSAGIIMLSWPWLISILVVYTGGWIATLIVFGAPGEIHQLVFTLAAADLLSIMAHAARMKAHLDLEALRRHEGTQRDELEAGLRALRETQTRLQRVLRAAPVIVLATDAVGRIRLAEGRGLVERGWGNVELVGRLAQDVLAVLPEERDRMLGALEGRSSAGTTCRDGATFDTFWSPSFEADGSLAGAVCVAIDVTERARVVEEKRRAQQREADIARLEEMDRFKTRILNTASHELNTPLTPMKLQMHLLKGSLDGMTDKQLRAIALLDRNVDRLADLVSDIMDVARLQEGELRLSPVDVALADVVREAVATYEAVAESKSIALRVDVDGGCVVHADARRIMQVLFNVLGNATKFTPEGGAISVTMRAMAKSVTVSVRDSGPGMDAEQIGRLFKPFSQVHDTARSTHGGTGLGLYISRGIAEQHGGTLTCESDGPGHGTTFTLTLPR